jgi:hypothetical protein
MWIEFRAEDVAGAGGMLLLNFTDSLLLAFPRPLPTGQVVLI